MAEFGGCVVLVLGSEGWCFLVLGADALFLLVTCETGSEVLSGLVCFPGHLEALLELVAWSLQALSVSGTSFCVFLPVISSWWSDWVCKGAKIIIDLGQCQFITKPLDLSSIEHGEGLVSIGILAHRLVPAALHTLKLLVVFPVVLGTYWVSISAVRLCGATADIRELGVLGGGGLPNRSGFVVIASGVLNSNDLGGEESSSVRFHIFLFQITI
jgi:hypothetical protein